MFQVNAKMLNNIIEEEDDCFVFFYEEVDPEAHAILAELEGEQIQKLRFWCVFFITRKPIF